jgi:hypothetical protein
LDLVFIFLLLCGFGFVFILAFLFGNLVSLLFFGLYFLLAIMGNHNGLKGDLFLALVAEDLD